MFRYYVPAVMCAFCATLLVAPIAYGRSLPSGEQLVNRMEQATAQEGSFRQTTQTVTIGQAMRETNTQTLTVDLRRHLLRQIGEDRTTKLPRTLLSDETFERISVGYRSATRSNGGPWSCQRFQPGQVKLTGKATFLASIGWPRKAINLGQTTWHGVPAWHVQATIFGGGPAAGATPLQRGDFLIRRSDHALLREMWRPSRRGVTTSTYSSYGTPVNIALPAACLTGAATPTVQPSISVQLHPVGSATVHGKAVLGASGMGTRVVLNVNGLQPHAEAAASIHYGTCSDLAHLSASAASLPNLRANANGTATATGRVLTALEKQDVRLSVVSDNHHVIVVVLPRGETAACGDIP